MRSARWLLACSCVLAVMTSACAGSATSGGGTALISHLMAPNDLVVRVDTSGGLVAPATALSPLPEFSLYGDGQVITEGPQIEIYPGPALPNVRSTRLTENGVQAILRAARSAGLLGPDRRIGFPPLADAPVTTFTVVAAGSRHVVAVYGLGMTPAANTSQSDRRARAALVAFRSKVLDLASGLPKGSVGGEELFNPAGLRVFVRSGSPPDQTGLKEPAIAWPLGTTLSAFGTPLNAFPQIRCGTATGEELAHLLPDARRATELTPWRSGSATYSLTFRPLLPDESGCPR
jgi:hypothetical protein